MRITDALRGEHAAMRPLIRSIREQTRPGTKVGKDLVTCYANGIKTTIIAHTTVEEPFLFFQLKNEPAVKHALMEHKQIDDLLTKAIETGDQATLHKATRLIIGHFAEEEQDVFPLAEKKLCAVKLSQLGAGWAEARGIKLA